MKIAAKAVAALGLLLLLSSFVPIAFANSTLVYPNPTAIPSGGTVTLQLKFTGVGGETDTMNSLEVCYGGSASGCGILTGVFFTFTTSPSFTCGGTSAQACTGEWDVTYPGGAVSACTISGPSGSSCVSGAGSWGSGASTSQSGSYGVVLIGTESTASGTFSADNAFTTPEFGAIGLILAVSLIGILALRRRSSLLPKASQAAGAN